MGSLIQKVTKRARELLKKKSKPQTKGKSANGTSRYSKSKRQKLLIGGVSVKLDGDKKTEILNIIGIKTKEEGKEKAQAHLVELLKLKTIQKIESKLVDYTTEIRNKGRIIYNAEEANEINIIEKVLRDVGNALKLSSDEDIGSFKTKQEELARIYKESDDLSKSGMNITLSISLEESIYKYNLFTGNKSEYELCNIEKEITALNIFKLFYDLTNMNEDQVVGTQGGAFAELFSVYDSEGKITSEKTYKKAEEGENFTERLNAYNDLLKQNKETIKDTRKEFVRVGLVIEKEKKGEKSTNLDEVSPGYIPTRKNPLEEEELESLPTPQQEIILLKDNEFTNLTDEQRDEFKTFLNEVKEGGTINTLDLTDEGETFKWGVSNGDDDKKFTLYTFYNRRAQLNEQLLKVAQKNNISDKAKGGLTSSSYGILKKAIETLNTKIRKLEVEYGSDIIDGNKITGLYTNIKRDIDAIKKAHNDFVGKKKYFYLRPDSLVEADLYDDSNLALKRAAAFSGGNPVKYKSTGQVVHIMFQNKKYKRVIYVKDKRNTKYCKMNNEYILLSKLKVIE